MLGQMASCLEDGALQLRRIYVELSRVRGMRSSLCVKPAKSLPEYFLLEERDSFDGIHAGQKSKIQLQLADAVERRIKLD